MAAAAHLMAASDVSSVEEGWRGSRVGGDPESTASEEECDLMVEALRRELEEIKNQLAWLTYHLDESPGPAEERGYGENESKHVRSSSSRLSGARSGADTPHTAKKRMERAKEAIEKATKAALAEKQRKRHFLEVVEKAEDSQRQFNEEYLRLLQVHAEQQRQRVQENSKRLLRRMRVREKKEKALRLRSKPARFRSLPSKEDASFLKNFYHSTYYQIIGVELQMKKAGKLKGLSDLKEFWELMLEPPPSPQPPLQLPKLTHSKATPTPHKPHPLAEEDEEGEYTSWALTALPPEHIRETERGARSKPHPLAKPVHLPQVRPIASLLSDSCTTAVQDVSRKEKARARQLRIETVERNREHTRHMYQQARANEMAMRKLLPDFDSLGLNKTEENDRERTPCDTKLQTPLSKTLTAHTSSAGRGAKTRPLKKARESPPEQRLPTPQEMVSSKRLEQQQHETQSAKPAEAGKMVAAPPLTLNTLLETGVVKESKGKSALWSNYK